MPNPYVNKVTVNNATIIDLTQDTAVASDVAAGKYFHLSTGERVAGTASGGGGDTYTLTTVVPQQTFTVSSSDHQATLTSTGGFEDGELYLITFDGEEYASPCELLWGADYTIGDVNPFMGNYTAANVFPVGLIWENGVMNVATKDTSQHTIKVEHLEFVDGPLNLIAKSITANGTYNASSDNADGYSSVTVNVSGGGNDFIVTLSYNDQTEMWEPDCTYAEAAAAASAGKSIVVDADVLSIDATADGEWNDFLQHLEYFVHQYYDSANGGIVETQYRLTANGLIVQGTTTYVIEPTGSMTITQNGTGIDVAQYASVDVVVPTGGSSMNVQTAQSTTRVANTAYTKTASLTCSKSGTYDVYWDCFRSSTSGTNGSQLYIGGSAYGSANTTFANGIHAQTNHLTGVQISANQEVAVYVRSRATNYYAYCGQLTIVQTA